MENPHHRGIRSYVLRQGRMSVAQQRALEDQQAHLIEFNTASALNFQQVFGRAAPTIVEIGFGMGHTTADIAQAKPTENFIGLEVHTPGVGALLKLIGDRSLQNLRIIQHDAVEVMSNMIAPASLAGVHVFFPDPWPKKRHHKRRLIQAEFVRLLTSRLQTGGYLHCATDWEEYAEQMLQVLDAEPALKNGSDGFAARPAYRTESSFERKGLAKGHGVWDLVFTKR